MKLNTRLSEIYIRFKNSHFIQLIKWQEIRTFS